MEDQMRIRTLGPRSLWLHAALVAGELPYALLCHHIYSTASPWRGNTFYVVALAGLLFLYVVELAIAAAAIVVLPGARSVADAAIVAGYMLYAISVLKEASRPQPVAAIAAAGGIAASIYAAADAGRIALAAGRARRRRWPPPSVGV